jgi:hypothetical protein
LAYRKVPKSLEEKKGGNSAAAAITEDIFDDKSDVSSQLSLPRPPSLKVPRL